MKKRKKIPQFASENAERSFWEKNDSTAFIDWSKAQLASFPNLKRSTQTISLRLPESLLLDIKNMANKRDVPYQSLMKMILSNAARQERI